MPQYTSPSSGWTANSIVGEFNAVSQAPITAADLMTPTGQANDPALESRRFMNPYTGVRKPVATGSLYQRPDVPSWLAQEVANLNAEQALRRSAQAELVNRVFEQAAVGGDTSLPWLEVLRAAVLQPGVEAGFGSAVVDPDFGNAARLQAEGARELAQASSAAIREPARLRAQRAAASSPLGFLNPLNRSTPPAGGSIPSSRADLTGAERVASSVFASNPFTSFRGYYTPGGAGYGAVRTPATNMAQPFAGGYAGPAQFTFDNPAYRAYAGPTFVR